tara:strand:+ start:8856 stop:10643 length:1788 start_codon:yes stop_codon:yes gene_type:complete
MADNVESAYESLAKLDKALVSSAKNAATLSRGISKVYQLQAGKKWEIFSRFISGSGLWKVQNKMRAIVQVMHQFTDAGNKAAEASAKQLNELSALTDAHKTLSEAQKMYGGTVTKDMAKAIASQEKYKDLGNDLAQQGKSSLEIGEAVAKQYMLDNSEKLRALTELTDFETARLQMLKEIDREVANSTKVLETSKKQMRKAIANEEQAEAKKKAKEEFKANKKLYLTDYNNKRKRYKADKKQYMKLFKEKARIEAQGGTVSASLQSKVDSASSRLGKTKGRMDDASSKIPNLVSRSKFGKTAQGFFKNWGRGQKKRAAVTNFFVKAKSKIGMFLKTGVTFLGYALLGILGLFLVIGIVKRAWGYFSAAYEESKGTFDFLMEMFMGAFTVIYESFIGIWDFLVNGEGTFLDFIGYLADIGFALFQVLLVIIVAQVMLLWVGVKGLYAAGKAYLKKEGIAGLFKMLLVIGAIWIAWYYMALLAAAVGLTTGLVVALVAGIALVIYGAIRSFGFLAKGGPASGMTVVGEKGPELLSLPHGSRVHSNSDSNRMLSGGNGNTVHVHVNGRVGASDKEIRDIATKVAKLINIEINRKTNVM